MARRRQGAAIDFLDCVALLPWWGGVGLALASHALLDRLSASPVGPMRPGQMGDFVQQALIAGFAGIGRWLVPLLCLLGAMVSFLRRRKRRALFGTVTGSNAASALDGMSWHEFELLVGESFRRQGYEVTEQGGAQADGGVDLILRKDRETFVVQCKQWKAFKVGVSVVRDLYGVMAARGAAGGFVVTSGTFTAEAKGFAAGRNVTLLDGPALLALINQSKAASMPTTPASPMRPRESVRASVAPMRTAPPAPAVADPEVAAPSCPTCEATMVRRMARTGAQAGSSFWGCSRFPACRGTR